MPSLCIIDDPRHICLYVVHEVDTPMLPTKFLYLKHLTISLITSSGPDFSPSYDYLSLVSFLDASPSLETFILEVTRHCSFILSCDDIYIWSLYWIQ
jgi:hypothetical protein